MGRHSTGACSCERSLRIELGYLLKKKMLVKGKINWCTLSWTDGHGRDAGNIRIICSGVQDDSFIELTYTLTERDGTKYDYDYKIQLTTVPSNLGKGEVFYFVCPKSGKRCRVLYKAYGSHKWKSRDAYQNYLFYNSQLYSKYDYANSRYWVLERRIEKMENEKYFTPSYNGKLTRKAERLNRLAIQRAKWDNIRWLEFSFPLSARKELHLFR